MSKTADRKAKTRGRPRAFDPEKALAQAMDVFWDAGFAASSLDELAGAMSMNRPSIYAAFGDKETLYVEALGRYRDAGADAMRAALDPKRPLREGVRRVYAEALAIYFRNRQAPRGCFLIGTAATESVRNEKVRATLGGSLRLYDKIMEERFRLALQNGELPRGSDPVALARLATSVMFAIAVRARAGESRKALEALADAGAALVALAAAAPPVLPS